MFGYKQGRHRGNFQQNLNVFSGSQYFGIFRMVLILLSESGIQSDINSYHDQCIHIVYSKAALTGVQSLHSVMWLHFACVFLIMKLGSRCNSFEKELLINRKPLPFGLDFNSVTCEIHSLLSLPCKHISSVPKGWTPAGKFWASKHFCSSCTTLLDTVHHFGIILSYFPLMWRKSEFTLQF